MNSFTILKEDLNKGQVPHCNLLNTAKCYIRAGISVVPVKPNSKEPAVKWSDYKTNLMGEEQVNELFHHNSNIAVIAGRISNLTVIDIDDAEKFADFYNLERLKDECKTIVKTPKGLHFWFKYDSDLKSKQYKQFGFDLKGDYALVNVPPSKVNGNEYFFKKSEGIKEIPQELKIKILKLQNKDSASNLSNEFEEIISKLRVARQLHDGIYRCYCPSHDDNEPSLDIGLRNNKLFLKCWAGCSRDEILDAIGIKEEARGDKYQIPIDIVRQAEEILKRKNLFDFIIEELDKAYVGRQKEKKLLFLLTLFRKLGVQTSCIITGESSTGKSSLVEAIVNTIPEEEKLTYTYSSEKFFLYLPQDLSGKVLTIYEMSGANALPFLKTFISEGRSALGTVLKVKGELKAFEISKETRGLVLFTTTTNLKIDEELANRSFVLHLDFNQKLLRNVFFSQKKEKRRSNILVAIQTLLKPYNVEIPFFEKIASYFPVDKPRRVRDFIKIINLIKAHCLLHQYQREKTEDGKLLATIEDYFAIYQLQDIIFEAMFDIPKPLHDFIMWLGEGKSKEEVFDYPKSRRTVYRYLNLLKKLGYIEEEQTLVKVVEKVEIVKLLPSPAILSDDTMTQNAQTVENKGIELCQSYLSQNGTMSQADKEQNKNVRLCHSAKACQTSMTQDKALIDKDLQKLCQSDTTESKKIFWDDKFDINKVEVLE